MASIQYLPEELLIAFFKQCLDPPPASAANTRTMLALVSRNWHAIVYHTPSLWTCIHYNDAGARNTLAILRSSNHPLDVVFQMDTYWPKKAQQSFKEACGVISRWKSVSLLFWLGDDLLPLLATPASLIESVEVMIDPDVRRNFFLDLFQGKAERLQSLVLRAVSIPWNSDMLSDLRRLELQDIRLSRRSPNLEEIISILAACPALTILRLDKVQIPPTVPNSTTPTVRLPKLKELYLDSDDGLVTTHLLNHIESPPCKALVVSCAAIGTDSALFQAISPFVPCADRGTLTLRMWDDSVHCILDSHQARFELRVVYRGFRDSDVLKLLAGMLRPDVLALDVSSELHSFKHSTIKEIVFAMSPFNVVALSVSDCRAANDVLHELATPVVTGTASRWHFPQLCELTIDAADLEPDKVLKMVEARYARRTHADDTLPLPLTKLTIEGPREEGSPVSELAAVARVLGTAKVQWELKPTLEDEVGEEDDE